MSLSRSSELVEEVLLVIFKNNSDWHKLWEPLPCSSIEETDGHVAEYESLSLFTPIFVTKRSDVSPLKHSPS